MHDHIWHCVNSLLRLLRRSFLSFLNYRWIVVVGLILEEHRCTWLGHWCLLLSLNGLSRRWKVVEECWSHLCLALVALVVLSCEEDCSCLFICIVRACCLPLRLRSLTLSKHRCGNWDSLLDLLILNLAFWLSYNLFDLIGSCNNICGCDLSAGCKVITHIRVLLS